jgi:arginine decarboxylase-like protein
MEYKVKIVDSILTKTSKGYFCIKIKCKKENGRIVYSDNFFSKKSKNLTTLEVIDLLNDYNIKVRKLFITPQYLNKKLKKLINREALCEATYVYKNTYKRRLFNINNYSNIGTILGGV